MYNETPSGGMSHSAALDILARAQPERLKRFAELLLSDMTDVSLIGNRTGLVMVPMRDTVENVDFHLGEVLVSEAHITDEAGRVGYGMVTGRDLERAMAMAVVDLHMAARGHEQATTHFLLQEQAHLAAADALRMRQVEATRVEMETF